MKAMEEALIAKLSEALQASTEAGYTTKELMTKLGMNFASRSQQERFRMLMDAELEAGRVVGTRALRINRFGTRTTVGVYMVVQQEGEAKPKADARRKTSRRK